ncbi:uncharacterized protein TNCV_4417231 [Trichonephila clavipes]|nr:uncharacterized protein TNCV_4417231 [Trichonephila clavipes]
MGNAKRRVSAKRKRQFPGNGSTIKHSKNSSATSTNTSSSKIKIPAVFDEEIAEYQCKPLTGNRIVDMEVLLNLVLQLCCPRRFEEGILLSEDSTYERSIESETFAADHVCHSNFQGSALKIEAVGATRIFQRSIVKRGLKYAHYYGDGDSKGFISVKDTYGKDSVTKYECIGHVQKRVGARLRKLKSKNKKSVW